MAYEQQRRGFEALQRSTAALGEVLDRALPHLPEANLTRMAASGGVTAISTKVVYCCLGIKHLNFALLGAA